VSLALVAWRCPECGRREAPRDERYCRVCYSKMVRCSRFEWFLSDALRGELAKSGRDFEIIEQRAFRDHRGFDWYFDISVWVRGSSAFGGYGELIEVDGTNHANQQRYSGKGGGYTRDQDKEWELRNNLRIHRRGWEIRHVPNDDCRRVAAGRTAALICADLIRRADTWC
jgi:hypothetical protein